MASEEDSVRFYVFGRDEWKKPVFTDSANMILGYESAVSLPSSCRGGARLAQISGGKEVLSEEAYSLGQTVRQVTLYGSEWMQVFPVQNTGEIIHAEEFSLDSYVAICELFEREHKKHELFVRGINEAYEIEVKELDKRRKIAIQEHAPDIEGIVRAACE